MTGNQIIKIFLASSSELKEDREQFEIFISRKNNQYIEQGIFLKLVIWEDFLDAMSQTRLQDEYNKAIRECDIVISLFKTKVGQYTEEEVMTAWTTFQQKGKPLIYTYFKEFTISSNQINLEDLKSLDNFKEKLSKLGHFYTTYKNIDNLKYKFGEQLNKIIHNLFNKINQIITNNEFVIKSVDNLTKSLEEVDYFLRHGLAQMIPKVEVLEPKDWTVIYNLCRVFEQERAFITRESYNYFKFILMPELENDLNLLLDTLREALANRQRANELGEDFDQSRDLTKVNLALGNAHKHYEKHNDHLQQCFQEILQQK